MRILRLLLLMLPLLASSAAPAFGGRLRPEGTAEKLGYRDGDSIVVIPARVRVIPAYCFAGCSGLRKVEFETGSKLGKISEFAFAECDDLEEFDMPPEVMHIAEGAFRGCRRLKSIDLPRRLQVISREAFAYCRSLNNIELPSTLREIKPLAFLDCQSLVISSIPSGVGKIGNNAFGRCYSLREMTLPEKCHSLDSYAFADCINLEKITMPRVGELLGELIFSGCTRLREIIERAPVAPMIECDSFLFEPSDTAAWNNCRIIVPAGHKISYTKSPYWNKFKHISEQ